MQGLGLEAEPGSAYTCKPKHGVPNRANVATARQGVSSSLKEGSSMNEHLIMGRQHAGSRDSWLQVASAPS